MIILSDYVNKGCLDCPHCIDDDGGIRCKQDNDPRRCEHGKGEVQYEFAKKN